MLLDTLWDRVQLRAQSHADRWLKRLRCVPLRYVLIGSFVVQSVGVLSVVGWLSFRNGQAAVDDLANQLQTSIAQRIEQHLEAYLSQPQLLQRLNRASIASGALDPTDLDSVEQYFWYQLSAKEGPAYLFFGGSEGEFVGIQQMEDGKRVLRRRDRTSAPDRISYALDDQRNRTEILEQRRFDSRERPWYKAALSSRNATWSPVYSSSSRSILKIDAVLPVYGQGGELQGVFSIEVTLAQLNTFLQSLTISPAGRAFILERSGNLVASSAPEAPESRGTSQPAPSKSAPSKSAPSKSAPSKSDRAKPERILGSQSQQPTIQAASRQMLDQFGSLTNIQAPTRFTFQSNGDLQLVYVTPFRDGRGLDWLVVVVVPETDFMSQITLNTHTTIWLCLATLGVAIAAGVGTSRWIVRPILRLSQSAQALAEGHWTQMATVRREDEVGQLARAFNRMAQQLQESFTAMSITNQQLEQRVQERTRSLTTSEAFNRSLLSAIPDLMVRVSQDGLLLDFWQPREFSAVFPQDVIGKSVFEILPADIAQQRVEAVQRALATNAIQIHEYQLVANQQTYYQESRVIALNETEALIMVRDITQRKRLEQELFRSQQFLNSVIEHMPLAMFVKDVHQEFRYVLWNRASERIYGISKDDAIGRNLYDLVSQELADQLSAEHQELVEQRCLREDEECFYRDGHEAVWQRVQKLPLINEQNEVTHLVYLAEDVTDRRRMEATLRQSEANYRDLVQTTNSIILRWSPSGCVTFMNDYGLRFFGYTAEELIGQSVIGTIVPETESSGRDLVQLIQNITHDPERYALNENENLCKNGDRVWVSWANKPIFDPQGQLVEILCVGTDATDRKQVQEALQQEKEKSEKLLLNILPEPIANRLKHDNSAIAESFDEVTILFADLVGFTDLSSQMPPLHLVDLLNQVFSRFDHLAEQYGLEKIKTIGDAYMVVAGLPIPRPDHAEAIAEMALAMQTAIQEFSTHSGTPLQIRIGINTGIVVAGVIGKKKFIYDLWGDAVNVASRMESQGEPGSIQVTEMTYLLLNHRYQFIDRGLITVKGKGQMNTYWLQGQK